MATLADALLALLEEGPAHGYRLRRRIDALLGDDAAIEGAHVYAALAMLERDGAIESRIEPSRGERQRRSYCLTQLGAERLRALRTRPAVGRAPVRRPLLLKVAILAWLGERMPERLLAVERTRRERAVRLLRRDARDGAVAAALRERTARHLEVELWLLDRLQEVASAPDATTRRTGSASR